MGGFLPPGGARPGSLLLSLVNNANRYDYVSAHNRTVTDMIELNETTNKSRRHWLRYAHLPMARHHVTEQLAASFDSLTALTPIILPTLDYLLLPNSQWDPTRQYLFQGAG